MANAIRPAKPKNIYYMASYRKSLPTLIYRWGLSHARTRASLLVLQNGLLLYLFLPLLDYCSLLFLDQVYLVYCCYLYPVHVPAHSRCLTHM